MGWVFYGHALCKSKFYGNSAAAAITATFHVVFPEFDETYNMSSPDYSVRGLLWGSTLTEYTGGVVIDCPKTGYSCDLQFKPKPMIGGIANVIEAKIKKGDEKRFVIKGRWDENMTIQDLATKEEKLFLAITPELKKNRLVRLVIPMKEQLPFIETPQGHFDAETTWDKTSRGIRNNNVQEANEHKEYLEETQRKKAKVLKERNEPFQHKLFRLDGQDWKYKYANSSRWNSEKDIREYEYEGIISTIVKSNDTSIPPSIPPRNRLESTSSVKGTKPTVAHDPKRDATPRLRAEPTPSGSAKKAITDAPPTVEVDPKVLDQISTATAQVAALKATVESLQSQNELLTKEISNMKWRMDNFESKVNLPPSSSKPLLFLICLIILVQVYTMIFGA